MSSGKWRKGSKGTKGRSTGKNQKKRPCPWCNKPYKGKYMAEHQQKHCSKKPLPEPQPQPAPTRYEPTVDHEKAETILKDFIIDRPKLNEILFSITCREMTSVVLHFFGDVGSGKSYLGELIGSAMEFHTVVVDADGFASLAYVQRILQSLADLETSKTLRGERSGLAIMN